MNSGMQQADRIRLNQRLVIIRGDPIRPPDASIVIPVNAQGDLEAVLTPLEDIACYRGRCSVEVILVVNNYPAQTPPPEIDQFQEMGVNVVAVPDARQPGESVVISARALGVRAAASDLTIHFDANCRIPNIDAYLAWCIPLMRSGCRLAYGHVGFYDVLKRPSVRARLALHHALRWCKRTLLRIPTTRGSGYAIDRELFLHLYDAGKLSVDLQVGPAVQLAGARIVYSDDPRLTVYTSGRRLRGGWIALIRYLYDRLQYNLKIIPTRRHPVGRASWMSLEQESERKMLEISQRVDG